MYIDIKNYEYTKADRVFCLDINGNKFPKYGIGKLRHTIKNRLCVAFRSYLSTKGKDMLTSKFVTEKGFEFTSVKLKNKLLKL